METEWKGRQIVNGKNSKAKNAAINNQKLSIDRMILSLELNGKLQSMTDIQLKNILLDKKVGGKPGHHIFRIQITQ